MNTEALNVKGSQGKYSKDYQDYLCRRSCVITIPITLEVPLFIKPAVIANKPDCIPNYNGYGVYEEKEHLVEAS